MSYIIAFVGILLSGVVATLVTYRLNTTKEHVFFMRRKTEELYLAVEGFDRSLSTYFLAAYPLVKGEISWNDFHDLSIKNDDRRDAEASLQVLMLIDIYFPDIKPIFDKYLEQRDTLGRILSEHKRAYKAGTVSREFFEPFHRAMLDLASRSKELKHAALAEARKFASADRLWPWNKSPS